MNLDGIPSNDIYNFSVALVIPTYKSFLSLASTISKSSTSLLDDINGITFEFNPIIITTLNSNPFIECIVTSFTASSAKSNSSFPSKIEHGIPIESK